MKLKCTYLNNARANFTICCKYPALVLWSWQMISCENQCSLSKETTVLCCSAACSYTIRNMLVYENNENDLKIGRQGIIDSFLLSVGNDTKWLPVITNSINNCVDRFGNEDIRKSKHTKYCGVIPLTIYEVIDCSYEQNFINCADWNPHSLEECKYSRDYVEYCLSDIRFKSIN